MSEPLTRRQRATIIARLRTEAEQSVREAGCTCRPTWSLTTTVHGPHRLPMWQSEHTDRCDLTVNVQEHTTPSDPTALMYTPGDSNIPAP